MAKNECSTTVVLTPSDTTWAIQLTDDGRGKAFRNRALEHFDDFLEGFDWQANPCGVMSAAEKRILTATIMQRTFAEFSTDERQRQLTINAATRTGLRMEMENNYENIVPVRSAPS